MSDLLDRVPATIPGLVQPGTYLWDELNQLFGRLVESVNGLNVHAPTEGDGNVHPFDEHWRDVTLTDRTSRVHAAWWCHDAASKHAGVHSMDAWNCVSLAQCGLPMTPQQIDTLARLVLRLAEVTGDQIHRRD